MTITGVVAASPKKFAALRVRWQAAHESERKAARELEYKYGKTWLAPSGKRAKYEAVAAREEAAAEAVFAWLDAHSPRCWRSGVPARWVLESLTFEDAVTAGQLATVPPPGYGSYPSDVARFAMPVREAVAAGW